MAGLDRLPEQYKDATKLRALLSSLIDPYDSTSTAAVDIVEDTRLDTAEGEQAKLNARKVGISLTGFPDAALRAITSTKILANRAFGGANDTMQIGSELGEFLSVDTQVGPVDTKYAEALPSKFTVAIATTIEARFKLFYRTIVCGSKTGGTLCLLSHGGTTAGAGTFLFDSTSRGYDQGQLTEIF